MVSLDIESPSVWAREDCYLTLLYAFKIPVIPGLRIEKVKIYVVKRNPLSTITNHYLKPFLNK